MNKYDALVEAINQNPAVLEELLNNESGAITRGSSPTRGDNAILRGILGNASSTDLNNINKMLSNNPVVQLFMSSSGSLDA